MHHQLGISENGHVVCSLGILRCAVLRRQAHVAILFPPGNMTGPAPVAVERWFVQWARYFPRVNYSVFERSGYRFAQQPSLRRLRGLICAEVASKEKSSASVLIQSKPILLWDTPKANRPPIEGGLNLRCAKPPREICALVWSRPAFRHRADQRHIASSRTELPRQ